MLIPGPGGLRPRRRAIRGAAQNSPQYYVDPQNVARTDVSVCPLSWDDNVAAYAQSYAAKRQGDCTLAHSGGPYGENSTQSIQLFLRQE
jgi:uncharacterized protein YkwD